MGDMSDDLMDKVIDELVEEELNGNKYNMSEQKQDAVFLSGMYLDRVHEKAPAFIITNQTIHVEQFIKWLEANKGLANEKGYIRIQGKESKNVDEKGNFKRYFQVDTYVPEKKEDTATPPAANELDESSIPF